MTNKTKTYILLAFVLGIWGVIGHKIISTINPEAPDMVKAEFSVAFTPKANTVLDTFSIQTTERDPFLGTLYTKKTSVIKKIKIPEMVWIPILYHGSVTKQASKNKVFVISIGDEQILMKLGETNKAVTLIKGTTNKITVTYKGNRKTINKT
tara:strand:- start:3533 stop:3988 length:456 start_codon:yes stop_codon:yes gene_type:complete